LYRYRAAQLLIEEVFAVAEVANLGADGIGNVLDGLRVVELVRDFLPLGMRLSVRGDRFGIVRPLHACDCAHTAGAGRVDDAGHRLLWLVGRIESRRGCARVGGVESGCGGRGTRGEGDFGAWRRRQVWGHG
jgi:hypothetical protein